MRRTKSKLVILISILLITLSIGGVVAYMFKQTPIINNEFEPANVDCVVNETINGNEKTSITITNTGNIDAYVRLRLVSYWVDADGNIMPKASVMPSFEIQSDWIEGANDTYYYESPVASNDTTTELLASTITLETSSEGYQQVVEVFAEAIQAKPVNAVTESWGASVSNDGTITSISN